MHIRSILAFILGIGGSVFVGASAVAQPFAGPTRDGAWMLVVEHEPKVKAESAWIRPMAGQPLVADLERLRALLATAPLEDTPEAAIRPLMLELPDANGQMQLFRVVESPIMEPGLARQFPTYKTYVGQGVTDPYATLRADIVAQGFHAQVLTPSGRWYIDPYSRDNTTCYTSYLATSLKAPEGDRPCEVHPSDEVRMQVLPSIVTVGPTRRNYRLACAATAEYTAFFGGTVALGQAGIVTAINRVTGVYEVELNVRLTLVANNSSLVFTVAASDPYTNNNGSTMLTQNQTTCTSVIGSANYDIGHVFSTAGGGVAILGVVCNSANKARGVTGQASPTGDAFWIDYVAHEMGHQFGAEHNFQGITGSCSGGNRNGATANEPGSGSLIMSYAGICGVDNIQAHSDAYFNFISYSEIQNYLALSGGCNTTTATGNSAPSVSTVGSTGFTIPKGTPFALTATASDPNGDAITYLWEDGNFGGATGTLLSAADNGVMPLFRSWTPSTSPTRYFPALSSVVAGTSSNAEKLPQLARAAFDFRCTVRDNRANGAGVSSANVNLAVNATAGPFTVTSPASATSWAAGSSQTVNWNVAGTTANGVNCANVAVLLSTNGGATFPITLLASTPNNGSATFVVPNNQTTTGRIMVKSISNVFYTVAAGVVTITPPINGVVLSGTGANTFADNVGNGNSNGRIDPGETAIQLTVPIQNTGNIAATGVSATLVSNTGTVTVASANSAYPNLAATVGTGSNATPFVLNVSASHPCGTPISLTLNITSAQGTGTYNLSLATGQAGGVVGPITVAYSGAVVAIPDNLPAGATANVVVAGLTGTISDVNFRFNGTSCSNAIGSTTVGLDHTYVGDLTITLQSPAGTIVTLVNRPTAAAGSAQGNNFCNTVLDDAGATSIQAIGNTGDPYTGKWAPSSPLSAFNGQNPNGTWILKAVDGAAVDTGNIRAFALVFTTTLPTTCDPPASGCTPAQITGQTGTSGGVCVGQPASFSVTATGSPAPTYQWRKNSVNINLATGPSYTIASVDASSAGSYDCVVTNACGSPQSVAVVLSVLGAACQPADLAWDTGEPLPPIGPCDSGMSNTGVNEGDYNAFFQGFFDAEPYCDIADDAGNTPPIDTNTGVNEGDYNAFFQLFFNGCP